MNTLKTILLHSTIILLLGLYSSGSRAMDKVEKSFFVGCTPGDSLIKSQLGIPDETTVDFIKWDLTFDNLGENSFLLNIAYGESQPNTLGFKQGGQRKTYQGKYSIATNNATEVYHLKSSQFPIEIAMIKLNANIFHLLTPQHHLMIGNGGWSYTLNNKTPDKTNNPLPVLKTSIKAIKDTSVQMVFIGRTPCQDFAAEHQLNVTESCFKLKWKLTLNRDPKTLQATTYAIRRIGTSERDITGNWVIIKGTASNPDAIIFQLDPGKPNQTISLLAGDENVLYFLHKQKELFIGNDNFSFTLNKTNPTP